MCVCVMGLWDTYTNHQIHCDNKKVSRVLAHCFHDYMNG